MKNRHCVDFRVADSDPLKQLIWGITGQKPAAKEPLIPGKDELAASRKTSFEPRLYPPLAHSPDQDQIGQLEILKLRQYSKDELGSKFDLRAFHDQVLGGGAVPMDVLSTRIHEWVAQQKVQAAAGAGGNLSH